MLVSDMSIEIAQLKEASQDILKDVNSLLAQLRKDSSEKSGTLEGLKYVTGNDHIVMIAAKDGERVVGMGFLHLITKVGSEAGHIEDVVVDGAYRGQGLGEKIIQKLIDIARKKNLTALHLTSKPARVVANKLYQKLGFELRETNVYRLKL